MLGVHRQRGPLKSTTYTRQPWMLGYLRDKSLLPPSPSLFCSSCTSWTSVLGKSCLVSQPKWMESHAPVGSAGRGWASRGRNPTFGIGSAWQATSAQGLESFCGTMRHIYLVLSSWVSFPSITARLLMFLAATSSGLDESSLL